MAEAEKARRLAAASCWLAAAWRTGEAVATARQPRRASEENMRAHLEGSATVPHTQVYTSKAISSNSAMVLLWRRRMNILMVRLEPSPSAADEHEKERQQEDLFDPRTRKIRSFAVERSFGRLYSAGHRPSP